MGEVSPAAPGQRSSGIRKGEREREGAAEAGFRPKTEKDLRPSEDPSRRGRAGAGGKLVLSGAETETDSPYPQQYLFFGARSSRSRPPPSLRSPPLSCSTRDGAPATGLQLGPLRSPLGALGGQLRGQRRLGLGLGLPCLSLAGVPEPLWPPRCTCLPAEQGGRRGWSNGLALVACGPGRVRDRQAASLWGGKWVRRAFCSWHAGMPGVWVVPSPRQGRSGERGRLVPPHGPWPWVNQV